MANIGELVGECNTVFEEMKKENKKFNELEKSQQDVILKTLKEVYQTSGDVHCSMELDKNGKGTIHIYDEAMSGGVMDRSGRRLENDIYIPTKDSYQDFRGLVSWGVRMYNLRQQNIHYANASYLEDSDNYYKGYSFTDWKSGSRRTSIERQLKKVPEQIVNRLNTRERELDVEMRAINETYELQANRNPNFKLQAFDEWFENATGTSYVSYLDTDTMKLGRKKNKFYHDFAEALKGEFEPEYDPERVDRQNFFDWYNRNFRTKDKKTAWENQTPKRQAELKALFWDIEKVEGNEPEMDERMKIYDKYRSVDGANGIHGAEFDRLVREMTRTFENRRKKSERREMNMELYGEDYDGDDE